MIHARKHAQGFTLVELLISLTAGIMVALAVVGLSREASNVFQDETRIAGAEMQLRSAIDRLRNDVARAAFMSTGNIYIDPLINTGGNASAKSNVANVPAAFYSATDMSLGSLAGLRLFTGGSAAATPLSAANGLSPDAIEIGGYLTNVEALAVGGASGTLPISANGGDPNNPCSGQTINLDVHGSPSLWRLVGYGLVPSGSGTTTYDSAINMAFDPVATSANPAGAVFIVRVVDTSNGPLQNTQYGVTCAAKAAGWPTGALYPSVYLDPRIQITMPLHAGYTTVNPVQIVRWQIGPALIADPMSSEAGVNGPKYDLTRQYLDATGTAVGSPEVVAEYAVDLKFAFTEDTTTDTTGDYLGAAGSTQVVYSFEDPTDNGNLASDPTKIAAGTDGPQRIRSVRIRLVTRAPTPDRTAPLAAGADYVYHYSLVDNPDGGTATGTLFARARTLISEVALQNQARFWYR